MSHLWVTCESYRVTTSESYIRVTCYCYKSEVTSPCGVTCPRSITEGQLLSFMRLCNRQHYLGWFYCLKFLRILNTLKLYHFDTCECVTQYWYYWDTSTMVYFSRHVVPRKEGVHYKAQLLECNTVCPDRGQSEELVNTYMITQPDFQQ
jgi:hypothetical protein